MAKSALKTKIYRRSIAPSAYMFWVYCTVCLYVSFWHCPVHLYVGACSAYMLNMPATSLTSAGNSTDSAAPLRRPLPETGHDADMLD